MPCIVLVAASEAEEGAVAASGPVSSQLADGAVEFKVNFASMEAGAVILGLLSSFSHMTVYPSQTRLPS